MMREQKMPLGPLPTHFSSYANENSREASPMRARIPSSTAERSPSAASHAEPSVLSFDARTPSADVENYLGSYDFLPSVSFDDLHQSIATASHDLGLSEFPAPAGPGVMGTRRPGEDSLKRAAEDDEEPRSTLPRKTSVSRPPRTSILRRPSASTRTPSFAVTSAATDHPTAAAAMATSSPRPRRQSAYPPMAGATKRAPRKSVGPGTIESTFTRPPPLRRPSLSAHHLATNMPDGGPSLGDNTQFTFTEGYRQLTFSRAAKAKSLQPPSRQPQLQVSTPEQHRLSTSGSKSPGRGSTRGVSTPSSSGKRQSSAHGLPWSGSHAHGLGARTISPTDARRVKRLSMMQTMAPPVPPSPPVAADATPPAGRVTSRSPSMIPRKSTTPSSSRTTPDPNRKSYSSGLSMSSNTSGNTARTSTGSLQPRLVVSSSNSRLPTPKPRTAANENGNDDDEEVPPVPAIPKAFESPKENPLEAPFFKPRKSSLPFDTGSINSVSTADISGAAHVKELGQDLAPSDLEKPPSHQSGDSESDASNHAAQTKKHLQPLRLPPLNLLPLSNPTAAKIAALQEQGAVTRHMTTTTTPPPRGRHPKSPSTPMTASRTSFFSRKDEVRTEPSLVSLRSSSAFHHARPESTSKDATPVVPIAKDGRQQRQTISPFISSSLPKSSTAEFTYIPRSKKPAESSMELSNEHRHHRLTGPRSQKLPRAPTADDLPAPSSPEEPNTPSSTSSLRRKLSLSWKRSASKSSLSLSGTEPLPAALPPRAKHDNMPPPRLPASATMQNLAIRGSPSPATKAAAQAEAKRRKSSGSSLKLFSGHDRTRSDSWGIKGAKKESSLPPDAHAVARLGSRALSAKGSDASLKPRSSTSFESDKQDLMAEEEMKKLASRRKETEQAARTLDALRNRASSKVRKSPEAALRSEKLNIYERGEIIDYPDVYFCGTKGASKRVGDTTAESTNFGFDDERGDYQIVKGDHLLYRYEVVDVLGKGSFGQVVRCIDHKTGGLVAVKIIRNKKRFHQQAIVEVNILKNLREWDPAKKHSMVSFTDSFYFRGHLCISTELLDMNLYEFIKLNNFNGFSLSLIRRFTKQLLSSLLLLKQHKVIHCDLKPENVLLVHPAHAEIKVIDFGSSCFEHEKVYTYIQSRFYRSPEVILGMTYGMPIDMWSLGCILAELLTGYPIFPGENEQEQLACIMEVFGPPEKHLIEKSTRKKLFFDSMGKPRAVVSSKGRRRRVSSKTLQQALKCDDEPFLDFLARCLRWDPDRRLKPDEAIRHEFITGQKPSTTLPRVSSLAARNESPIKRNNTITTPSTKRPLPDPPTATFRANTVVRTRDARGISPNKSTVGGPRGISPGKSTVGATTRRQSSVTAVGAVPPKRTSAGMTSTAPSTLPRVTRTLSAKQDLASAGASAAMTRRA